MYDIGISEIAVTAKYEDTEQRSIKYDAEAAVRPSKCPNPGCVSTLLPNRHDSTEYLLHDVKTEGKLSYINLRIRRYKCPNCGFVFPDEFTISFPICWRCIVRQIGELIVDKLREIIGNIKAASTTLGGQAEDMSSAAGQIKDTSDSVSQVVEDMARGATDQDETIQTASENTGTLSDAIQSVADNAGVLSATASNMNTASQKSADALKNLQENMNNMGAAVREISSIMKDTNDSVQGVNEKVDGITSIATQTNLLALNASIEAARAGEAGRGFAVVAEEIGKLATDSAQTASEIRDEMAVLLGQSQKATEKTNEVSIIGKTVIAVLAETVDVINGLIDNVNSTVSGVTDISGLTDACDANKNVIVDAMSGLSAISEENAASTQETSASMQELNATVAELAESADKLSKIAEGLENDLKFFNI